MIKVVSKLVGMFRLRCTAKPSVENLDGLLNNRPCALKYHLIKSQSPNLLVNSGAL